MEYQIVDNHVVSEFVYAVSHPPQKLWHTEGYSAFSLKNSKPRTADIVVVKVS